jgi:hypothetical protein
MSEIALSIFFIKPKTIIIYLKELVASDWLTAMRKIVMPNE